MPVTRCGSQSRPDPHRNPGETAYFKPSTKGSDRFGGTSVFRQHFGLGTHAKVDSVEMPWPSGKRRSFKDVAADRALFIEGS